MILNIRAATGTTEAQGYILEGYAIVFNQFTIDPISDQLGTYYELTTKQAIDNYFNTDWVDFPLTLEHSKKWKLGIVSRNPETSTVTISVDDVGLYFSTVITDEEIATELQNVIGANQIKGCSFIFIDPQPELQKRGNTDLRIISNISELRDITICAYPAYAQTEVAIEGEKENNLELELEYLKLIQTN